VRFAGIPATVDDSLVNELLAKGEAHRETLFAPGTPVRFVDGPLLGLEGVFERAEGEGRAIVLLEFLARKQQVRVATHQLSRA
jgi:transcriptional antiterminator RfaH